MTARVTTLKGPDAGAYYVEALPNYYLDSGEPQGHWHGMGAELLGIEGEVVDRQFLRLMAGMHPRLRQESSLGRSYGETSVRGFDVTASAPKSVSTLFAIGDDQTRQRVLAAHDTAVKAMFGWVEDHAHTRYRINGKVAVLDAEGIAAATFRQHTSRALDPQLHTHVVVANRVRSDDERWLALDARSLKLDQRTLSAIYHATLRSELSNQLKVRWQPVVNGIAEIDDIADEVLEEFSTRTAGLQRRTDEKIDRFVDNMDREPTPRERWTLEREAVSDSRPAKSKEVDANILHARWDNQVRELGFPPEQIVGNAANRVTPKQLDDSILGAACHAAIKTLSEKQSSWRPAELSREIAAALPTNTVFDSTQIGNILEHATTWTIENHCVDISRPFKDGVRLRKDGRPVTESIIGRAITTQAILDQELRILDWAEQRRSRKSIPELKAVERASCQLTGPQAETAAAVAGDANLVLVVGPAGTGKTTALAPAVAQLKADGRTVFGVAPSAAAAKVLAKETQVEADTIDKLLAEHNLERPPDHRYDLPPGATVIVDEAGMLATNKLDQFAKLANERKWRIALVGDPMQFSAVGRGGMFEYLIETHGAIELDRVHRFEEEWERMASLRLRRGESSVAELYDTKGHLHGGTATRMQTEALEAWWETRRRGESVSLSAPAQETVAELNRLAQQMRVEAGEIASTGRMIKLDSGFLRVGDEVVTRRNERQLTTNQGLPVRNRDRWTISTVHRDGDLTVEGESGAIRLPVDYVKEFVELGYAQTSHAAQGRTVGRSILYLDSPSDSRGIYVPMTRGRISNDVFVVTDGQRDAVDIVADAIGCNWIDRPALARQAELASEPQGNATIETEKLLTPVEVAHLLTAQSQISYSLAESTNILRGLSGEPARLRAGLNRMSTDLEDVQARSLEAKAVLDEYDRPLRRRGRQAAIAKALDTGEKTSFEMEALKLRIATNEQQHADSENQLQDAKAVDAKRPQLQKRLAEVTRQLERDRDLRTDRLKQSPSKQVVERLGNRPTNEEGLRAWDIASGQLDQFFAASSQGRGALDQRAAEQIQDATVAAISALETATRRQKASHRPLHRGAPGREL